MSCPKRNCECTKEDRTQQIIDSLHEQLEEFIKDKETFSGGFAARAQALEREGPSTPSTDSSRCNGTSRDFRIPGSTMSSTSKPYTRRHSSYGSTYGGTNSEEKPNEDVFEAATESPPSVPPYRSLLDLSTPRLEKSQSERPSTRRPGEEEFKFSMNSTSKPYTRRHSSYRSTYGGTNSEEKPDEDVFEAATESPPSASPYLSPLDLSIARYQRSIRESPPTRRPGEEEFKYLGKRSNKNLDYPWLSPKSSASPSLSPLDLSIARYQRSIRESPPTRRPGEEEFKYSGKRSNKNLDYPWLSPKSRNFAHT